MAVHFHKLKVKEVRQETPDCVSVSFVVPDELKKDFEFAQGQNITVKKILMVKIFVVPTQSVQRLMKTN